jgi:urease accessory protein
MSTEVNPSREGFQGPALGGVQGQSPWLLRVLTFLSPAFPTGAYAYSHGLEWAVEAGDVTGRETLTAWIADLLAHGSLWSDSILLRHVWRADVETLAAHASACAPTRERQEETLAQGAAFLRAAGVWFDLPQDIPMPLPIAAGLGLRQAGLEESTACLAFLHAAVASLVSAGVRLVPLGQTDGLRSQAALESAIMDTAQRTGDASLDDIGGVCLRADIAAMRHETQHTRLFRS